MPDLLEPPEFTEVLRTHLAEDVRRTRFEPIAAADIRTAAAAAPRRAGRLPWLAAAAALALLVPAGFVAVTLNSRPLPAVPAPSEPVSASPSRPAETRAPVAAWFARLTAPIAVDGHAQVTMDDAVYLITTLPQDGACQLQGYRYQSAVDTWRPLPAGPSYPGSECATPHVFAWAGGPDVAVAVAGPLVYRFSPESSRWTSLPAPGVLDCEPLGLGSGVFCLAGSRYLFHDAGSGGWQEGEVPSMAGASDPTAHRVEIAGREAVLVVGEGAAGEVLAGSWDPANGSFTPIGPHPGLGGASFQVQVTRDGFAVLGPEDPTADTALVVELASGHWRQVEIPRLDGRLIRERPSDAGWVLTVYYEATDRALLNGYLYRPADGTWAAAAPLPRAEFDEGPHDWVGSTGICRRLTPFNCWGLSVGTLPEVLVGVDPLDITGSNDELR
mgnify:CR=1 FL=1